jgi:hypothetical protein
LALSDGEVVERLKRIRSSVWFYRR